VSDVLGIRRFLLEDDTARWFTRCLEQLAAGRPVPAYGSTEWLAADRALQIAGALVAAEAYRRDGLFLPQALEDELAERRRRLDHEDAVAFADLAGRIVAFDDLARRAASLAKGPTHAELAERRAS
jgi:hypothetical protein